MVRNWKQSTSGADAVINQRLSSNPRFVNRYSDTAYYGGEVVCESITKKSDLKLILAAPKMLDACKQFVIAFDNDNMIQLDNAYKTAKFVINLAEPVQLLLPAYGSSIAAQKDRLISKISCALRGLVHLHLCEEEGIVSCQPSSSDWQKAVDDAGEALNYLNNNS